LLICEEIGCGGSQPAVLAAVEWGSVSRPGTLGSVSREQFVLAAPLTYGLLIAEAPWIFTERKFSSITTLNCSHNSSSRRRRCRADEHVLM
jgi:hypothetical protein